MTRPRPAHAFREYAKRPPPLWMRVLWVPLAVLMPVALWQQRGAVAGMVAVVVYGLLFVAMALRPAAVTAWFARHPRLDGFAVMPFTFLAAALITGWPLWICAAVGVAVWVLALTERRRRAQTAQAATGSGSPTGAGAPTGAGDST